MLPANVKTRRPTIANKPTPDQIFFRINTQTCTPLQERRAGGWASIKLLKNPQPEQIDRQTSARKQANSPHRWKGKHQDSKRRRARKKDSQAHKKEGV
jgi:hypothetical protein